MNIVRQLLERSDPSREWGYEPDNRPEFISKLRDEVDKIYLKFYTVSLNWWERWEFPPLPPIFYEC